MSREEAQNILANAAGVKLVDDPENYKFPTPADVVGTDPTWVGRVRKSLDNPKAIDLFVFSSGYCSVAFHELLHEAN